MTSNQRRLERVAWLLVPAGPVLSLWLPSFLRFQSPPGDDWLSIVFPTAFATLPFLFLALFVRSKNREPQLKSAPVTVGIIAAMTATVVAMGLLYISFWSDDGIGVNFGLVFLVMLSPLLIVPIMTIAYAIGAYACNSAPRRKDAEPEN